MAPFKVAIVGGGMTGLIAALHLDRLGIDFILLEAYSEITPEVGASLALHPNFQRVLDQLRVLEDVERESIEGVALSMSGAGTPAYEHYIADRLHAATGGYGITTFTRSQLLKILYRNISDEGKKKICTSQRVNHIEQLPGHRGVRLHMKDGQTHDVDVVIGADGAHSVVRSEMWRLAEAAGSKTFMGDKGEDAKTEYGCVFGLSTITGDLRDDTCYQVSGEDMCIGIFGGAKGEALWFLFFKVDEGKTENGLNFPRWTQEEGEEICKKYAGAKLTEKTNFGNVFANRYRLTSQACPNHTLRRWHWGRLVCLGDSVAKTTPIIAQGGAQGAESVLMLVDRLHDALKHDANDELYAETLTTSTIEDILTGVNTMREPRVREFVDTSQIIIRTLTWSSWFFRILGKWILPWLPTSVIVGQALGPWKRAYQSTSLPSPSGSKRNIAAGKDANGAKGEPLVDAKPVSQCNS